MKKVFVNTSKNYEILIGRDLLKDSGKFIKEVAGGNIAAVITDSNVDPLYGETVCRSLQESGYKVVKHVFTAGEENKNLATLGEILDFLAGNRLDRKDIIVALGGGVTGDMAGFAAAIYMRGIKFVQVPTTVLAAVDSSVGGKTAIDLAAGKNLAGAFYQPELVLCDCDTLDSLPDRDYYNGFAEIIKYAMIWDNSLFESITSRKSVNIEEVIEKCVTIKKEVVENDEFESGIRQILNFGHTIGHAVEKASDFELYHGEAVSVGMVLMTKAAVIRGKCTDDCLSTLTQAIGTVNLPCECNFTSGELIDIIKSDKKAKGDSINIVVPVSPGKCVIENVSFETMKELLDSTL